MQRIVETTPAHKSSGSALIPESSKELRRHLVETSVRSMHLQNLRSFQLTRLFSSLRSGEIAELRAGHYDRFGINRLLTLHERIKSKFRYHVLLPACPERETDLDLQRLFRALAEVDDACELAAAELGERSYPLTKIAVLNAGTICMLSIDAIRKSPKGWQREAPALSAILFQVEEMLEAVREKDWTVTKSIQALKRAGEILEDVAGGRNSVDRRKH